MKGIPLFIDGIRVESDDDSGGAVMDGLTASTEWTIDPCGAEWVGLYILGPLR
jgi:hypothetical protein